MELIIYGIKNCDTMKKTISFLEQEGVTYRFVDYKKQQPDPAMLVRFADKVGFEALINRNGTTYRKLSEEEKQQVTDEESVLAMLSQKSSMIKRPIIEFPDGSLIVGFDQEEISKKIKS